VPISKNKARGYHNTALRQQANVRDRQQRTPLSHTSRRFKADPGATDILGKAQAAVIWQPLDMEVGAGPLHPATFLRASRPGKLERRLCCNLAAESYRIGRYGGKTPTRLQHIIQFQVGVRNVHQDNASGTLPGFSESTGGSDHCVHDIRFVEDKLESPPWAPWGLGLGNLAHRVWKSPNYLLFNRFGRS